MEGELVIARLHITENRILSQLKSVIEVAITSSSFSGMKRRSHTGDHSISKTVTV